MQHRATLIALAASSAIWVDLLIWLVLSEWIVHHRSYNCLVSKFLSKNGSPWTWWVHQLAVRRSEPTLNGYPLWGSLLWLVPSVELWIPHIAVGRSWWSGHFGLASPVGSSSSKPLQDTFVQAKTRDCFAVGRSGVERVRTSINSCDSHLNVVFVLSEGALPVTINIYIYTHIIYIHLHSHIAS